MAYALFKGTDQSIYDVFESKTELAAARAVLVSSRPECSPPHLVAGYDWPGQVHGTRSVCPSDSRGRRLYSPLDPAQLGGISSV